MGLQDNGKAKQDIVEGKTCLGIELGSTRIKAALIGEDHEVLATGGHDWENRLVNGVWTYDLGDVWEGLQDAFANLAANVQAKYGIPLARIGSAGVSAMMHGYLVFDKDGKQLVPFRTWRNTITEQASTLLTKELGFNIPQRWSVAHVYQAILNKEEHVADIDLLTTLACYVHEQLTGERVAGLGEASGMFPVDSAANDYNKKMLAQFDAMAQSHGVGWKLKDILPTVLNAGEAAGTITEQGAKLLDPSGKTQLAGTPMCPPEGDAGTGMVATNSVAVRTGNISAGTSMFAMMVMEKELSRVYPEIDMVTTPAGLPVAMVHCNNCTSDMDAWIRMFEEVSETMGAKVDKSTLYNKLFNKALEGEADCGGLLSYNYLSGEHTTGFEEGRPLFTRTPDSNMNLANFMRTLLLSSMATIRLGMDILEEEGVSMEQFMGHGGLFKVKGVGQRLMAGVLETPVAVLESAGEGGAWGIALLAAYMMNRQPGESLEDYLANKVFADAEGEVVQPDSGDVKGSTAYIKRYAKGLAIERAAVEHL